MPNVVIYEYREHSVKCLFSIQNYGVKATFYRVSPQTPNNDTKNRFDKIAPFKQYCSWFRFCRFCCYHLSREQIFVVFNVTIIYHAAFSIICVVISTASLGHLQEYFRDMQSLFGRINRHKARLFYRLEGANCGEHVQRSQRYRVVPWDRFLIIMSIVTKPRNMRWSQYNQIVLGISFFDSSSFTAYIISTAFTLKELSLHESIGNKTTCGFQGWLFQIGIAVVKSTNPWVIIIIFHYIILLLRSKWVRVKFILKA